MKNASEGKFRKKRNKFSQISNTAIQDETMSCQARFLYCLISSYITIPDFNLYKGFLKEKANLGKDAFNKYWKELKDRGYLIQYEIRDEKGHYNYEYELLDEPFEDKNSQSGTSNNKTESYLADSDKAGVGLSASGKSAPNNNIKNNININNINNNNNKCKEIVNDYFDKISFVVEENQKKDRFHSFLSNLKYEELLPIAKLETSDAVSFYYAAMNCYENKEIINPEGFLRIAIKNIMSFIISNNNKAITKSYKLHNCKNAYMDEIENYDASKNRPVTQDEIDAFNKLRGCNEIVVSF